ncbi:hypothetical protein Ahy_A03g013784 [Arachis hypogaea]|uniref:Protein FAR1-RELATED SEQUENCE n=1 Tax=Arachis hypogaea TaxID=3818 RepID=A0A445DW83_ARAHY|nr:hypothetical protein Ahy_A03g013784 [Arachis hypogaea]
MEYPKQDTKQADMFADRHMLVPVFFNDEFWAGMSSTQYSESMHSVFDKYLNSKSSLLQFVRQYQNCVIDKEKKELECDATDLRGIIPCVSSSPIEKQFQREYTNSMFRDVQDQCIKKADCDISSVNHHGTSIVCEVDQQKMVFDMLVYSRYQVVYCSQSSDVQYDFFIFQSNDILCCHSLAVLLHFRMTTVTSQYIVSRWSKNVSRRHTYIRSSIDMDRSNESMTILRNCVLIFTTSLRISWLLQWLLLSCVMPWTVLDRSSKNTRNSSIKLHMYQGPNGNAQPSPTNVAYSYKDTQWAYSEMTDDLATHSGSFISLLNSFHNAEQLYMCT